jgi:hypothetical protein
MSSSLNLHSGQDTLTREIANELTNKTYPDMSSEELSEAYKNLNIKNLSKFPRKERFINDPELSDQKIALVTFVPCKGARPDKDGVYGWLKSRGSFKNELQANDRAKEIIKTFDSFHHIHHVPVGVPYPMTLDQKYVEETDEVDISKKAKEDVEHDFKRLREDDKKIVTEMKEAEERLLDDVKDDKPVDELEEYIVKRVKRATLIFTLTETRKKMDQMVENLKRAEEFVNEKDAKDSTLKEKCLEKYEESRRRAGITEDMDSKENMVYYILRDLPEGIYDM